MSGEDAHADGAVLHNRNQALIDALAEPTAVVSAQGRVVMRNLAWERHRGRDDDGPSDPTRAAIASVLSADHDQSTIHLGSGAPGHGTLWIRRFPGLPDTALVSSIDESRRREYDRQDSGARQFDVIFDHAPIGMALTNLVGQFIQVNEAFCEMTGRDGQELCGLQAQLLVHPEDWDAANDERARLMVGDIAAYQGQTRLLHATGRTIWCLSSVAAVSSTAGEPLYYISQYQDITPLKEAESRLDRLASHDALTGLPNRLLFLDRLAGGLARSQRLAGRVAVLFVDLDGFKAVNDRCGHVAGDAVLLEVAARLSRAVRPGDTVARLGGDEFVVCCEDIGDGAEAESIAERLIGAMSPSFEAGGARFRIGASVGIALAVDDRVDPEALIHEADLAMYRAKRRGRGRYELFSRSPAVS